MTWSASENNLPDALFTSLVWNKYLQLTFLI